MSFRIEEKIPVTASQAATALGSMTDKGATPLYPDRIISSCYFDTPNLRLYVESEEGVLPRRKIRLRHYPESDDDTFTLETKISSVEGRFKTSKKLTAEEAQRLQMVGIFDRNYGILKPIVWVTYRRSYYQVRGIRLTVDSQITYRKVNGSQRTAHERSNVIELKAPYETSRDMLCDLIEQPRRRFSKYSNAIKLLGLSQI